MRFPCLHLPRWSPALVVWATCAIGADSGSNGSATLRTWKSQTEWYGRQAVLPQLAAPTLQHSELRLQMGDDPSWADPRYDDSAWPVIARSQLPLHAGVFWLRMRVREASGDRTPSLAFVSPGAAMEVYWNGVLTASNGQPGNSRAEEIGGAVKLVFEVPRQEPADAEHVIAVRMSTYRTAGFDEWAGGLRLYTIHSDKFHALDAPLNFFSGMGFGAMLTIAIAACIMWVLADRRLILLLLACLCASAGLLVVLASANMIWDYPAAWTYSFSLSRVLLVLLAASLVVAITQVLLFPAWPRPWMVAPLLLGAAVAYYTLPNGMNPMIHALWRSAFVSALGLAGWAVLRGRRVAWPILAGVLATYLVFEASPKKFAHTQFLVGFLPMLTGFMSAIAWQVRRERIQARDTRMTAARLEIELLKKSIQPHFLLNTLTALSQVVEEKPAAAVRLIEDLATEFRSLARFSGEKQVPMGDELALCRAHLRVMSARTELAWSLEAEGIDARALVPPGLFLTLIENGFSHQRARPDATVFTLRAIPSGDAVRYVFVSPGTMIADTHRVLGGTGLRYIRARLDESFHGAWKLSQGAVSDGWETTIEIGAVHGVAAV